MSDSVLNNFFNNVSGDIADIENLEQQVRLGIETGALQEFATADATNQLLLSQDIPVQATNAFYEIYLDELQEGDGEYELDAADINQLQQLAQQCPYTHGTAVYQARALLHLTEATYTRYESPCELGYQNGTAKTGGLPPDASEAASDEKEVLFTMQPNPAQTAVSLNWLNFTPNATTVVTVYTNQGAMARKVKIQENSTFILELEGLPSGLYFVHLAHNGEIASVEKLIVQ